MYIGSIGIFLEKKFDLLRSFSSVLFVSGHTAEIFGWRNDQELMILSQEELQANRLGHI